MFFICLQGLSGFAGTSSVAAALGYSLSKNGYRTLCIDGYHDYLKNRSSTTDLLFNLETATEGWFEMVKGRCSTPKLLKYEDRCYYLPFGQKGDIYNPQLSLEYVQGLFEHCRSLKKLDYVIIDGGIRGSEFAKAAARLSDLAISLMLAEGNSLSIYDSAVINSNEYLTFNKFVLKSTVMNDIELLVRNSPYAHRFLNSTISYDEIVMQSFLQQMPVTRYLPVCAASNAIERLMFEIIYLLNHRGTEV